MRQVASVDQEMNWGDTTLKAGGVIFIFFLLLDIVLKIIALVCHDSVYDAASLGLTPISINNCSAVKMLDGGDIFLSVCDNFRIDVRRFIDQIPGPVGISIMPHEYERLVALAPWVREQVSFNR
jgi:hypothetical protein